MNENIILTDCDGVLCDWEYAFRHWMLLEKKLNAINPEEYNVGAQFNLSKAEGKKLVREFNDSAAIAFLPPLRDAVYYMKRLNMLHGYKFHCITSLSTNKYAQKLRIQNLELLFGDNLFDEYVILGCGDDKDDALEPYRDSECWWIEDKPKNAELGQSLGLNSILVAHEHNANYNGDIPRYQRWKDIYKHISGEL